MIAASKCAFQAVSIRAQDGLLASSMCSVNKCIAVEGLPSGLPSSLRRISDLLPRSTAEGWFFPNCLLIDEQFAATGGVSRTVFFKNALALVPAHRRIPVSVMKNSPQLEARIGEGQLNTMRRSKVLRFAKARVLVPIENSPYRITSAKRIFVHPPQLVNGSPNHRFGLPPNADWNHFNSFGTVNYGKVLQILWLCSLPFRDNDNSCCWGASPRSSG